MNKNKFKTFLNNLKIAFNKNKKKSITILVILILAIISSVTLIAYSFYVNRSTNLIISGIANLDSSDVKIDIYREDRDANGTGIETYSLSYYVPGQTTYTYNSSKTTCDDGLSINSFDGTAFTVNASKKGKCKVYFDAIDGYIEDYVVNLFVQQTPGNTEDKNYNQMGKLPLYEVGYYYTINTSKTNCTNGAIVSIEGKNIIVLTTQKAVCNVYADKNSDSTSPTISSVSTNGTKITFTATDNISVAMYGLSTSNTTEPSEWKYFNGTSQTVTFEYTTEGTYYLWVKDSAGNSAVSSAITIVIDSSAPVVGTIEAYTKNAVIALSDDTNLAGYAVTTTSATPTSWTTVTGKTASVTYAASSNGTYYVHVKDAAGKTSSKSFSMVCAASTTANFDYTGSVQTYSMACNGSYTLYVWGAEGGYRSSTNYSGKGGYSTGTLTNQTHGKTLYVYVGGAGGSGSSGCGSTICTGGYNGGGYRYKYYGGGGATDIRISGGAWNDATGLKNRIIVAGGGGSDGAKTKKGMYGGGTTGGTSTENYTANKNYCGQGGNQTYSGYSASYTITSQATTGLNSNTLNYYAGGFGFGGGGVYLSNGYGGAGGGGWYGGSGTVPDSSGDDDRGGGGGSGFIYTSSTASNVPSGTTLSSSYYLSSASTVNGGTSFTGTGGTAETGHSGNGYARIVFTP